MEEKNDYEHLDPPIVSREESVYSLPFSHHTYANQKLQVLPEYQRYDNSSIKIVNGQSVPPQYPSYDNQQSQIKTEPQVVQISVESSRAIASRYWIIGGVIIAILLVIATVAVTTLLVTKRESDESDTDTSTKWAEWSEWSDCSTTCNEGVRNRERQCSGEDCHGNYTESTQCFVMVCPAGYGTWSTWEPWSSCEKTCGLSGQQRSRICNKLDNTLACVGASEQTRQCNNGDCPDCSKPCSGYWKHNCLRCTCPGNSVSGRVLTGHGEPINNVKISPADKPYYTLATTRVNGVYNLADICIGSELLFHREGFVGFTTSFQTELGNITLEEIEPLAMAKELKNEARLVGDCIKLTCDTKGKPGPDYVEWMQNGRNVLSGSNILKLDSVQKEDSGLYQCRANNDYSSIYSRTVVIQVEESASDFCNPSPKPLYTNLPKGCFFEEQQHVNIGHCLNVACSFGNEGCDNETIARCDVVEYDEVDITCGQQLLPIMVAKQCGCVAPSSTAEITKSYEIWGVALTTDNASPVYSANITLNGEYVGKTDFYGQFHLKNILDNPRVTITFTPTLGDFAVYSTVINFDDAQHNVEYMTFRIPRRLPRIDRNANNDMELSLGNSQFSNPFGQIAIPANSLETKDGNIYQGDAAIYIEIADTRDMDALEFAPGDYSAIDAEGAELMLQSTGMFRLDIEDQHGNDLVLTGNVSVAIQDKMDNDILPTKLWSLNQNTGRWQQISDFKRTNRVRTAGLRGKRQADLGDFSSELEAIHINNQWINLDQVTMDSCLSKIRVFEDNEFNQENEISNARLSIISGTSSRGYTVSALRPDSDYNNANGYCIIHPCDTNRTPWTEGYHGYIKGTYRNEILHPSPNEDKFPLELEYSSSNETAKATFNLAFTKNGPLYNIDFNDPWSFGSCSNAQEGHYFRFYTKHILTCKLIENDRYSGTGFNKYKWIPDTDGYMYVKILTEWVEETTVRAVSYVGQNNNNEFELTPGQPYGTREHCTENQAVCLEVKTSGVVISETGEPSRNILTAVNISLIESDVDFVVETREQWKIHPYNNTIQIQDDQIDVLLLNIRTEQYGRSFGIYHHKDDKKMAEHACRGGVDQGNVQKPPMVQDNWAFKFSRKN